MFACPSVLFPECSLWPLSLPLRLSFASSAADGVITSGSILAEGPAPADASATQGCLPGRHLLQHTKDMGSSCASMPSPAVYSKVLGAVSWGEDASGVYQLRASASHSCLGRAPFLEPPSGPTRQRTAVAASLVRTTEQPHSN